MLKNPQKKCKQKGNVSSAQKPGGLGKIKDPGHKRVSDHQGLKVMEVLKNCRERYGGP